MALKGKALESILPLAEAYLKGAPSHPAQSKLEDARAALNSPSVPIEHTAFIARRWVEQNRGLNESSQIASLIELLRVETADD